MSTVQEQDLELVFYVPFKVKKRRFIVKPRLIKMLLCLGNVSYVSVLLSSILVALFFSPFEFNLLVHPVSYLGLTLFTPAPFLFDLSCALGGALIAWVLVLLKKKMNVEDGNSRVKRELSRLGLITGILGCAGCALVAMFSLDSPLIANDRLQKLQN